MSKKVQKTLTGAMAAMMATGVVATPAMAATNNTDVDALYKAAYQATQKALTEKTQAAVNEAREAIKALPANLDWAIGEFSKQVDTVQHPILVEIVTAIKKLDEEATQANINAAKKAIPAELRDEWKKSYSAAIDVHQQALITKANEAVKEAQALRSDAAIKAANELLAELATADAQGVKDWAATMQDRVNSIEKYAIQITKVNVVDRYQVEVEFAETTENLKNVTVEVKDANGKVREVEAKSLLKGSKVARFDFTKVNGASELAGIWTVNGVKVDVTGISLVKEAVSAATEVLKTTSEAQKFDALAKVQEKGYINGLLGEYDVQNYFIFDKYQGKDAAKEYAKAIEDKKSEIDNPEDLQAVIDAVNVSLAGNIDVAELIELANSPEVTTTQFMNAMANLELTKVNTKWTDSYKDEIKLLNTADKLELVQDAVYKVNKNIIESIDYTLSATTSATLKENAKIAENKVNLIEEFYKDDVDKVTAKADLLYKTKVDLGIFNVKLVSDVTDLETALKNLSDIVNDKDVFSFADHVNTKIIPEYFEDKATESGIFATSVDKASKVRDALLGVQNRVAQTEMAKVADAIRNGSSETLLKALRSEKLGLKNVVDINKDAYFVDRAFISDKMGVNNYSYSELEKAIKAVNGRVEMKNATTKADMRAGLVALCDNTNSNILLGYSTNQITDLAEEFLNLRKDKLISLSNMKSILGDQVDPGFDVDMITEFEIVDGVVDSKIEAVNNNRKSATVELKDALEAIVGKDKIDAGKLQDYVNKDKAYDNYTDIRNALGL